MSRSSTTKPQPKTGDGTDLGIVDALAQLLVSYWGILAKRAGDHDLSMIQTRLLGVLRDRQPGMNELARMLELDKSSVTGLVDRAEKRGLVTRTVSTTDRRAVRVSLTRSGRTLVGQVVDTFQMEIATMLASLTPTEQSSLSGLASRVVVASAAGRGVDLLALARPS